MHLEREKYRLIQYDFVQFFAEHLSDLSRVFNGDLQEMLVLAIVGQALMHGLKQGRENGAISASRIADVTGVPRQTVRRKLESLKARGWVEQGAEGGWSLVMQDGVTRAQEDLFELDQRAVKRVIKLVRRLAPHV